MLYHIKLKKAMSYTGIVNATREEPNVYTHDKDIATAAVRSGYFDLIDVEEDEAKADSALLTAAGEEAEDSGALRQGLSGQPVHYRPEKAGR